MVELAEKDIRIVALSAAMIDGTGLEKFAARFPGRSFDVGIAESHAVTFAAGLARAGFRPVAAIYSTFLQRGYDMMIHDICLQNLPVIFCLDRAGLVGEDGPTHHGAFDVAYLRHIPNMTVMAPATPEELAAMLELAVKIEGPVAIRYPKGVGLYTGSVPCGPLESGKAELLRSGKDIAIISIGSMAGVALKTAEALGARKINAAVVNARFVKPMDLNTISQICRDTKRIVTIEDGTLEGGFGSAVLEAVCGMGIKGIQVRRFGLPDRFIEHGKREELFIKYNLTPDAICDVIVREMF